MAYPGDIQLKESRNDQVKVKIMLAVFNNARGVNKKFVPPGEVLLPTTLLYLKI